MTTNSSLYAVLTVATPNGVGYIIGCFSLSSERKEAFRPVLFLVGLLGPLINFTTLSPKNKEQRKEQAREGHREKWKSGTKRQEGANNGHSGTIRGR